MTSPVLFAGAFQTIYCMLLFLTGLFLILLVLVQRGRGGGLSGAFGGMGGQSAFGAKAGDTFTKVTVVAATFWIILCLIGVKFLDTGPSVLVGGPKPAATGASDPSLDGPVTPDGESAAAGDAETGQLLGDGTAAEADPDNTDSMAIGAAGGEDAAPAAEIEKMDSSAAGETSDDAGAQ